MNHEFLNSKLRRFIRRHQWQGLWRKLALCWAGAALAVGAVVWAQEATGWSSPFTLPAIAALVATVVAVVVIRHFEQKPDLRWAAQQIEAAHPELKGVLLTAVQQNLARGVEPGYLQHRVLEEAVARSQEQDWRKVVPTSRLVWTQVAHVAALMCFAFALANIRIAGPVPKKAEALAWKGADGISVTPGDTSLERGESLVVLARFARTLPPAVALVVKEDGVAPRTIPLVKSLADPVFGGSVTEVTKDFTYQLEYRGERTREFKVGVFEHPKLVRADADLVFPDYTKLPPKHIEDTRRISAVEGTKLSFTLQLNKSVASAQLVARDGQKTVVPLTVVAGQPVATLNALTLVKTQTYDLRLVDGDGRANKVAAPFVIDVQPNRPPELRLASPRGDVRPSAIEEISFEGTVFDDFGSSAYGIAYSMAGAEPKFIPLGGGTAAKEKKTFTHMLKLEELGAKPDDLVSWFAWADDIGPDGKVRRTSSDLFFGEVRPFDEIFRESQGMESDDPQQKQTPQGNQARKLTELQKQIINATWRLQRDAVAPKFAEDAKVVADSQAQALAQAEEAMGEARSPRAQATWTEVTKAMEQAIVKLKEAATAPKALAQALPAEQAAYQALLKLQTRETNITRSRSRGQGQGGQGQQNQRQIDQLDLTQAENRYETQRQAQAPQNAERKEQMQVTNRLQELARRQQDLNERMKELQTTLQEAKTEQEREDIKRRLKRLQEEQQQMLADVDELRQRMDKPENQSRMADEKQQLDKTRDDIQKAVEESEKGSVAQALASGTRAQRQLQQLREELRKQNSSQFAEDLREMRQEARELAREQEKLTQQIESQGATSTRKSLSSASAGDQKELIEQLGLQKDRLNKLTERAQQISEQAENTEPALSRQLYDSVRKVSQDDANSVKETKQELLREGLMTRELLERMQKTSEREGGGKSLELATDMLREGYLPQAGQAGRRAREGVDELRRGVERAADSVLGDEAEQLKLAQSELDAITDQLTRELTQAQGENGAPQPGGKPEDRQRQAGAQPGEKGGQPAPGGPEAEPAQPGAQPGQSPQPGKGVANNPGPEGQGAPGGERGTGGQPGQGENRVADGRGERTQPREGRSGQRGGFDVGGALNGGGDEQPGINGEPGGMYRGGPFVGGNFAPWNDRLRNVEELLDAPDLRNAVANARERARLLRRDMVQERKKPDWAVVQLQILKPLVEVRARVAEELSRRDSKESLAPIDRDPVPARFAESVRRYYEELGKDKPDSK